MIKIVKILGFFAAVSWHGGGLEAFTLISNSGRVAYWKTNHVDYYFHSSVSAANKDALRNSFNAWQAVPGLGLTITELGTTSDEPSDSDGKNFIMWITSNWRTLSFRPPAQALAVTLLSFDSGDGSISDADIYFNDEFFDWGNLSGGEPLIDVENIGTHEVGHLLGLDHSSEDPGEDNSELLDATMYYAASYGEIERRDLEVSDELGIRALYSTESRTTPTIESVTLVSESGGNYKYRVTGQNFGELTSFMLTKDSTAVYDEVARYRTINSSSEAEITLTLAGFSNGNVRLVAANGPSNYSDFTMKIDNASLEATSGGGGGGCSLQARPPARFSWVTFYFMFLAIMSLLLARRRFQRDRD